MLPMHSNGENLRGVVIKTQKSYTYKLDLENETVEGTIDGIEAVEQAIYKILNTERYQELIYSWNYGIELKGLFGRSREYVCSELPLRITEALKQDDRIKDVSSFKFSFKKNTVAVTFSVKTIYGAVTAGKEVTI